MSIPIPWANQRLLALVLQVGEDQGNPGDMPIKVASEKRFDITTSIDSYLESESKLRMQPLRKRQIRKVPTVLYTTAQDAFNVQRIIKWV